jgi:oxepin-CoA hydrolase/3-oxo-5,6-dehydrosuberyl-CoA semialdehyde dehydrogenase
LLNFIRSVIKQVQQKADSWVDIEGGIGNLFANASLRRKFPDEVFCIDGESS